MRKILILLFVSSSVLAAKQIRSEINRYRLLRDRQLIEKAIIAQEHDSFFSFDLFISSGLKDLIGDISDSTSESSSSSQVTGVTEALSKNVNTERQLLLDVEAGIPLPYFTYQNLKFLPSLFYQMHIGASVSVNNQDDPLVPLAQIYVNQTTSYGLHSKIKRMNKKGETYGVSLYKRVRTDLLVSRNATAIATSEKLINLDELDKEERVYALDLSFYKNKPDYRYEAHIKGVKLMDASSETEAKLGITPLFHLKYEKDYNLGKFVASPFFGLHYRKKYSAFDAIYIGSKFSISKNSPTRFILKLDNETINFNAGLEFSKFQFQYGLKSPYRNPVDDMWTSATHQITMRFPF
ncbi:hypothetical protein [Bacteriovorax sp. DB6_IX]|uniref:hypothetical protein n=1 Tax=Bacteriovorax sp. DB6_IX TaxID=1353530 RepID=UPI000389F978|nr:hypothetical protein [Bacteriovorax sp. DB6_IX]EQC51747.1 hypothetical protein M901_1935 [Bacteriovorax sp. DB6_IX]